MLVERLDIYIFELSIFQNIELFVFYLLKRYLICLDITFLSIIVFLL